MNIDEALLLADGISLTALGSKGQDCALLVLAAEVRRQYAELDCRTCRHFANTAACDSVLKCIDGSSYQRDGAVRMWETK